MGSSSWFLPSRQATTRRPAMAANSVADDEGSRCTGWAAINEKFDDNDDGCDRERERDREIDRKREDTIVLSLLFT